MVFPSDCRQILAQVAAPQNPDLRGRFGLGFKGLESYGKFELLKRIGAGGMGEVFLAREVGSSEPLVLKRILPHLTENPRFLRLFLDEARIAARLVHPNIARILELGEADGSWYVAMEHVPGRDLRDLLRRMKERDELTPVEVALRIG